MLRLSYVDDLNDLASGKDADDTIDLAMKSEQVLIQQVKTVGFMLNDSKTTYIQTNIDDEKLIERGLKPVRETEILGFPFITSKTTVDISPAGDMILKSLNSRAKTIHAARIFVQSYPRRVSVTRSLIFSCLTNLCLVYAYDKTGKIFKKIQIKVNDLVRATGLRNTTHRFDLNKVLGTSLTDFAKQGVITNGLKQMKANNWTFQRPSSIRRQFPANSFMHKSRELWNEQKIADREKILKLYAKGKFKAIGSFLKSRRKLKYDPKIHIKNAWIDYSNRPKPSTSESSKRKRT